MRSKAPSNMDGEELNEAVDKKQALPDMVLKRIYFDAQHQMNEAEAEMMQRYYANNKVYSEKDLNVMRSKILLVFREISNMLRDAGVITWDDAETENILLYNRVSSDYELCLKLTRYNPMSVRTLIHLSGYLNYGLHKLGLTDLLISSGPDDDDVTDGEGW